MKVAWATATAPLEPVAVTGHGHVAERLAERSAQSEGWSVCRFESWTVITGRDLPWVDGVVYLGELPGAPSLLVPVHRRPLVPPDLLMRSVHRLVGAGSRVALLPSDDGERVSVLALPGGEP